MLELGLARTALDAAWHLNSWDMALSVDYARLLESVGQPTSALVVAHWAFSLASTDSVSLGRLGTLYLGLRQYEDAEAVADRLSPLDPDVSDALKTLIEEERRDTAEDD
jgi:hypothetical protein